MQRWAKWFAERGHEVHLISPDDEDIEGVKIHLIGKKKEGSVTNFVRKMFQTRKLVWKIKPDILHAHYAFGHGTFAAFANYHPFVASVYGSDVLRDARESMIKKIVISQTLKRADAVVPTAQFMKNYLQKEFKLPENKIIRIPWGVDLKIFHRGYEREVKEMKKRLSIGDNSFVIASIKSMFPQWNISNILDAVPHVIKKYPDTIFIFIRGYGSKEFENFLKNKAKIMGVERNVRFISRFLSPRDMAILLNMVNAFVWIPKTDQFANTILEGMVCGAIPIVSNIEVYKQYLKDGENSFFVNPDDPRDIAEKIIYCIEHPEIQEKFYNVNKRIVETNENWNKNARRMESLYERLINRGERDWKNP